MPTTDFEKVVELVKALNPAEQWRLRDLLDVWLAPPQSPLSEEELAQELLREGILDHVPPPIRDAKSFENYKPVDRY